MVFVQLVVAYCRHYILRPLSAAVIKFYNHFRAPVSFILHGSYDVAGYYMSVLFIILAV